MSSGLMLRREVCATSFDMAIIKGVESLWTGQFTQRFKTEEEEKN